MNEQLVRVLDQESDKIVAVPRSELAPGFVRVYIPGQGEVFIPTMPSPVANTSTALLAGNSGQSS